MKLTLHGGMANNMYVFAKSLAQIGIDVTFIRDRVDKYPFSQPSWEDVEAILPYQEIDEASKWSWSQWTAWEAANQWTEPTWCVDPIGQSGNSWTGTSAAAAPWPLSTVARLIGVDCRYATEVLKLMRQSDALLVCGIQGISLAYMSGRPYVIWPHGGDLLIAAGLLAPPLLQPRSRARHVALGFLLRSAIKGAQWIGTHDAKLLSGHIGSTQRALHGVTVRKFPIPLRVQKRLPRDDRLRTLHRRFEDWGIHLPDTKIYGFVPSRIDFHWKGQEIILQSLINTNHQNIHIIFSGWGNDYKKAYHMVQSYDLKGKVTFLPFAVSKPILYEIFQSADFVIDQFKFGTYGTAAVEAMSCGCPVVMHIDESAFSNRGWSPPPVINVSNAAGLARFWRSITDNFGQLGIVGSAAQRWVSEVHDPEIIAQSLLEGLGCATDRTSRYAVQRLTHRV
jgi:glycosyltransferase involved in cell wall biosynthesis